MPSSILLRAVLGAVALSAGAPGAAFAAAQVRLGPAGGPAGTVVALQGAGFPSSKSVRVGVAGAPGRVVRTSRSGSFSLRLTVPAGRRGPVKLVSRSGRSRVVSTFNVSSVAGADGVVEIASAAGRRVRAAAAGPGGLLRLSGTGFAARVPLTVSVAGVRSRVTTARTGSFALAVGLPPTTPVGAARIVVAGRNVRVAFGIRIAASAPSATVPVAPRTPPAPPEPPPPPPPPPPALIALWHMDETSGTTMADAAGAHTGTLMRTVKLGGPGVAGAAYGFGGSGWVNVPPADDLNPGDADVRIGISMRATAVPPPVPPPEDWDLIRKGVNTSGTYFKVEYYPSGQASCGFRGTTGQAQITAGPALHDGQWHSVECVKTPSAIELVVDGQGYSQPATIGAISNADPVVIASRAGTAEFFQGELDEAGIQVG